jgi:L-fuconolactonase
VTETGAVIDAQLHVSSDHTIDEHVVTMRAAGVDGAVLVQSSRAGFDHSALVESAQCYNGRFAVVGAIDPGRHDVGEAAAEWRAQPVSVGVRIVVLSEQQRAELAGGRWDALLRAAEEAGLPVFVFALKLFDEIAALARAYPSLQLVIDHIGLPQRPLFELDPEPFGALPELLALAEYENVAVKWTAAPAMSLDPFPFPDLRAPLHRTLEAFGLERVMWGTDITRVGELHTYCEAAGYLRWADDLSAAQRGALMGGSLSALLGWRPEVSDP